MLTAILSLYFTIQLGYSAVSNDPNNDVCTKGLRNGGCTCNYSGNQTLSIAVNCAGRNFTDVPYDLPKNTAELDLRFNLLRDIVEIDFKGMRSLQKLKLSNNRIGKINKLSFDTLTNLTTIELANNYLTSVNNDLFYHLPRLESIDLSNNNITTITGDAFYSLPRLNRIKLKGNPLQCDCAMSKFRQWLNYVNSKSFYLDGAECSDNNNSTLFDVDFANCTEQLFQNNLSCHVCAAQGSHENCPQQTCGGTIKNRVCFSRIAYLSGTLAVTKACDQSDSCLRLYEVKNADECYRNTSADISCMFCCLGDDCNDRQLGRRTKTLQYDVTLRIDKDLSSDIQNATTFNNFKVNTTKTIASAFQRLSISYNVILDAIGPPATTLYLSILYTTLTEIDTSNHLDIVNNTILSMRTIGGDDDQPVIRIGINAVCPKETTYNSNETFNWPRAAFWDTVTIYCPSGFSSFASRLCNRTTRRWDQPNISACSALQTSTSTRSARSSSTTTPRPTTSTGRTVTFDDLPNGITDDNADYTTRTILRLSENAETFKEEYINTTVFVLERLLQLLNKSSSNTRGEDIAMTMNNLLDADQDAFVASEQDYGAATRFLNTIDTLVEVVDIKADDFYVVGKNLALFASVTPTSNTGITLSTSLQPGEKLERGKVTVDKQGNVPEIPASWLYLPPSALHARQGYNTGRITLAAFRNDKLFQIIQQKQEQKGYSKTVAKRSVRLVNSMVLSGSVIGKDVRNLREPIRFRFQQDEKNAENPSCKFFVESGANAKTWSDEGCNVTRYVQGEYTECQCDHLTNFALLMDVYGSGAKLSISELKTLTYVSYIGAAVSIIGLIITLLTYFMFRKLRTNKPAVLLIHFSVVLLVLNLVFLIGQQNYTLGSASGCKAVAVMMHFLLLSAFCWMLVEAFYMYRAVTAVFNPDFSHFNLKTCLLGYGLPAAIVVVSLGINSSNNYGKQEGGICWLERVPFYAAFLAPVSLVLLLNIIVFIIVMWKLLRGSSNKEIRAQKAKTESLDIAKQLRRAMVLVITLGLGWLFAFIAVSRATLPIQIVFTVFNGLQGLFIFIFHCLLNPDVRAHWARILRTKEGVMSKSMSTGLTDSADKNGYREAKKTSAL